jgi:hypothetical protein
MKIPCLILSNHRELNWDINRYFDTAKMFVVSSVIIVAPTQDTSFIINSKKQYMMKNGDSKLIFITMAFILQFGYVLRSQAQYNEVIQSITSYCYEPSCPPSNAIDNKMNTFFVVHPYVACSDKNVYLHITLKRSIKAARVRIVAPGIAGIRVNVGNITGYHTTLLADETFYIVKPDQFQTLSFYRAGPGQVCEITIDELSIDGISMPFVYDAAGQMTLRSIYLGLGTKSAVAMAPDTYDQQGEEYQLEDMVDLQKILIYPNPTRDQIKIDFEKISNPNMQALAELYSINGTLILSAKMEGNMGVLDLSQQPPGIYILTITINNERSQWRVIKE